MSNSSKSLLVPLLKLRSSVEGGREEEEREEGME